MEIKEFTVKRNESLIDFISDIEGWKLCCKKLHWTSENINTHRTLDDLYNTLNDYEDNLVETYLGLRGNFNVDDIKVTEHQFNSGLDLISVIESKILTFYQEVPQASIIYSGILALTDEFIANVQKLKYLIRMC